MSDTTTILQIPLLAAQSQSFSVTLSGVVFQMRIIYRDAVGTGWTIDIDDADGNNLLAGLALVLGVNMLESFVDDRLPSGGLYAASQPQFDTDPTYEGLGVDTLLYYVP